MDAPQPDHEEDPKWSFTPARGVRPKVWSSTSQPWLRAEGPDLVSHPHRWNNKEMLKILHQYWWKTLMPCGRIMIFMCILYENFSEPKALCMAQLQATSFWLPLAQHKTAGWWVPPPTIPGLQLEQYMPSPASSNFRVVREQRTLALARALQAHAEESGCPAGVLCDAGRELQWCMAPLLALSGDEIVEASLQPVEGECRTSLTPEKEATLLGNIKPDIQSDVKPDIKAPHVLALLEIWE